MASIPDDVRRFILTSIPSVPFLEAALLLHRARAAAPTAQEIAHSLYVSDRRAFELLQSLVESGIVATSATEPPRYRYAPRDEQMAAAIDALADAYARDLVGVANLIHDSTRKNAQRFADAFKLRRDR